MRLPNTHQPVSKTLVNPTPCVVSPIWKHAFATAQRLLQFCIGWNSHLHASADGWLMQKSTTGMPNAFLNVPRSSRAGKAANWMKQGCPAQSR
jgi:hypothetical protein